jgi:uncharacterized protein YbgA (DUF1722 family)
VANGKKLTPRKLFDRYEQLLLEALALKTITKKNNNVLQHLMGYFIKQLTADEKQELLEVIEQYRNGYVPLLVPLTLINHYGRKYDQPYPKIQTCLNSHPVELKLRTSV